jgi:hypothetical protein
MGRATSDQQGNATATAVAALILLGGIGYIGLQVLQIGYHAYFV